MATDKKKIEALRTKFIVDGKVAEEKLLEAHAELEEKLGEQGATLGEIRKANEAYQRSMQEFQQAQQAIQQYQAAFAQMKPVVDWVQQNQQGLQQYQQFVQSGGAQRAAAQAAAQQPGYELLTAPEKKSLQDEFLRATQEQLLNPFAQRFEQGFMQRANAFMDQLRQESAQQSRAQMTVFNNALKLALPKEQYERLNKNWETTLKFADRSFDPQEFAEQHLGLQAELETLREKAKKYEDEAEQRSRAEVGAVTGPAPSLFSDEQPAPKNREERMAQTLTAFRNEVGNDAYKDLMPTKSGGR
jgi:hypothetical protein